MKIIKLSANITAPRKEVNYRWQGSRIIMKLNGLHYESNWRVENELTQIYFAKATFDGNDYDTSKLIDDTIYEDYYHNDLVEHNKKDLNKHLRVFGTLKQLGDIKWQLEN